MEGTATSGGGNLSVDGRGREAGGILPLAIRVPGSFLFYRSAPQAARRIWFLVRERRGTDWNEVATRRARAKELTEWAKAMRRPWTTAVAGQHTGDPRTARTPSREQQTIVFFLLEFARGSINSTCYLTCPIVREDVAIVDVGVVFFFLFDCPFFTACPRVRQSDSNRDSSKACSSLCSRLPCVSCGVGSTAHSSTRYCSQ